MHPIQEIVLKQKAGEHAGIYSACTANEHALLAVFQRANARKAYALIESTANQVDQNGGYTGMTPADFYSYVLKLAERVDFPKDKLILGGDHLGPLTAAHLNESEAMEYSRALVSAYVLAGFTKIHLDTSMRLADDDASAPLCNEIIAKRGAYLCEVAERAYNELRANNTTAQPPVYVIGSEVPIPGGAQGEDEGISVTSAHDCMLTLDAFKGAFTARGLSEEVWSRVVGLVVQPGVEFGDASIHEYVRERAKDLTGAFKLVQGIVFEGHSTDYQSPIKLREMVADGIAILKVGPALTFALREALFSLELMERQLYCGKCAKLSNFRQVLEDRMLENPDNWRKHYHGSASAQRFARAYSFSDRARYYLPDKAVQDSIETLLDNLKAVEIPLTLVSQYMPMQFMALQSKRIELTPEALLQDRVGNCIDGYLYATL